MAAETEGDSLLPQDVRAMQELLEQHDILEYEPWVIDQLLTFAYRKSNK